MIPGLGRDDIRPVGVMPAGQHATSLSRKAAATHRQTALNQQPPPQDDRGTAIPAGEAVGGELPARGVLLDHRVGGQLAQHRRLSPCGAEVRALGPLAEPGLDHERDTIGDQALGIRLRPPARRQARRDASRARSAARWRSGPLVSSAPRSSPDSSTQPRSR